MIFALIYATFEVPLLLLGLSTRTDAEDAPYNIPFDNEPPDELTDEEELSMYAEKLYPPTDTSTEDEADR